MHATVEAVETTTVQLPFRNVPERHLRRQNPHVKFHDVIQIELSDGSCGFGTQPRYVWPSNPEELDLSKLSGENATDLLWDDRLPPGGQRALFDAVGRSLEVPIHRLLGPQIHDRTPLSWWCIDMSPADWLAECQRAIEEGYTSVKLKGRPWWDIWEQIELLSANLPEWFSIGIDFNGTLLDAERAIPVLQDLESYPQVKSFEEPIPAADLEGLAAIDDAIDVDLALHYGDPSAPAAICGDVPDGFVLYSGRVEEIMRMGHVSAMADQPVFLQFIGIGPTAAFTLHYGAVTETAEWPAVTTYEIYEESLLTDPIEVEDGFATVPEEPGLGYELDRRAVEKYRVDPPKNEPNPSVLTEWLWPREDVRAYLTSNSQTPHARSGGLPYYQRDAHARGIPDDGSDIWEELYQHAREEEPYVVSGPSPFAE